MPLSNTQEQIDDAIREICYLEPFATINDIAEEIDITRQAVLNNIDEVLDARPDITTRKVGQANVYYIDKDPMPKLIVEETEWVIELDRSSRPAFYAEIRRAVDDSDFDYVVHWYDSGLEELDDYAPTEYEVGQVVSMYMSEPVTIRAYESEYIPMDDYRAR